ncbi:MAG: L-seryl-tRNA(Sec) selenium transferase [Lachnospiraceae bacterium]|nr:L-seryl-tRNA(Sec) selenium transferase [Lachnospiraceae bacterium]
MDRNLLYRMIPKVDLLLEHDSIKKLTETYGYRVVLEAVRNETDSLREYIRMSEDEEEAAGRIKALPERIADYAQRLCSPNVRKVINGTGTILHTNLGRAPMSEEQAEKLARIVSGYSNLEYNLETGARGERYAHFEELICRLTGAEAAMVVNNNAAAVLLILNTLTKGGEVIVSRGELVEIGGKFRIPDVMELSGARLVEVGTTNKTHPDDYEEAITEETRAIMKVHTSNYRVVGFTESVSAQELKQMADEHCIPVIEDLGSGTLVNLEQYGLEHEPTIQESVSAGIDVISFSGDKLLGGPQAGIIIGRKKYIDQMKKNQLTRALRADKFTVTALELVLLEYLNEETLTERVPVLRMLRESPESVRSRAETLCGMIRERNVRADLAVEEAFSQVGGGSMPTVLIKSAAVVIRPRGMSAAGLEKQMRHLDVPVICRVAEDAVILDVRTIPADDFEEAALLLGEVLA